MIINDLYNNKKQSVSEGTEGQVVFSGTGANGSTYEIIQSSPTDFMIHANGRHIDTYGSLQRAMIVLKNEVPGLQRGMAEGSLNEFAITPDDNPGGKQAGRWLITYMTKDGTTKEKIMVGKNANAVSKYFEFKYRRKPLSVVPYIDDMDLRGELDNLGLDEQGVAEGLPQILRKVVPGYARREIDRKMDAEKFGRTDVDRDANYYRYKKIQDKIKEQGVAEAQTDYQKRRQRERDVDAGKPVKPEPRNPQNDYFARRKKEKEQGVDEGWKSALGGAALAGSMALGGAAAQAQNAPSGEDFLPAIVAHVTFKVNGNTVTKDINLGTSFKSPGQASAALEKFLKEKGIKFYNFTLERVSDKEYNNNYLEKTPLTDKGTPAPYHTADKGYTPSNDASGDYMVKEGPVTKKPQPYNDPNWTKKLPKDQLDALGGKRYSKDKKPVSEVSLGDYRKKAAVSQAVAQTNRFFDRDDPAKVAAADQTIAKRTKGLARADARVRPYTPPPQDAEKQQRDLTAKYPNIDELVRRAELNRDPDYEMADGQAYYAARDAEQNYQKLKQIQRVIQGLNESQAPFKKNYLYEGLDRGSLNTVKLWESAGQRIVEAQLTADQINQLFTAAEQGATAAGGNRTMIGKGKDAAMEVNKAWEELKTKVATSGPIKNMDAAYDVAADKLKQATGGDQGVMKYVQKYRDFAKKYPVAQSLIYSALIAAAGISGAGLGGAAALGLFKLVDKLLQGDKFSSAAYAGAKTGALAYGASKVADYFKGPKAPEGGGGLDPNDPDVAAFNQDVADMRGYDNYMTKNPTSSLSPQEYAAKISKASALTPDGSELTSQASMMNNLASKMGLPPGAHQATFQGGVPVTIDGKAVPLDLLTGDQQRNIEAARTMRQAMSGSQSLAQKAAAAAAAPDKTYESLNVHASYKLTEADLYFIFSATTQLNEGIWDSIKGTASKYAGKAADWAKTQGTNLTTKVTADKLKSAWTKARSPTDSDAVYQVLTKAGVAPQVMDTVYKSMNIPSPGQTTTSAAPGANTAAAPAQPAAPKAPTVAPGAPTATAPGGAADFGAGVGPGVGKQQTVAPTTADAASPAPTAQPEPTTAPSNGIKFDLMGRPYKPTPAAATPAAEPAAEPVDEPATVAKSTAAPKTATTTAGAPGFNAGNLAQLPGMAQYMKPQAKATPDYSKGPTGYGKTTMSVSPMQTKTTALAAPAAKSSVIPATNTMMPTNMMPTSTVKQPAAKMPADNRINKVKADNPNIAAQTPYVQGRKGFGANPTQFAKYTPSTSATANLGQGINNMFKQPSTVAPTVAAPKTKQKDVAMAESLTWSKNFDPGRSLHRQIKQDL